MQLAVPARPQNSRCDMLEHPAEVFSYFRNSGVSSVVCEEKHMGSRAIVARRNITVREENAAAALEVMSRFALDPRWLVYLPPTISPCETSKLPDMLEHPAEVFSYFRNSGVSSVVCEEKHMG